MGRRPPTLELRVLSESGRTERALVLPRSARAALLAGAVAVLGGLITVAAVAPSAIRAYRAHREYDVQLARRSQLGGRLRALVDGLAELERQSAELELRVARLEAIYGLASAPPAAAREAGAGSGRDSIFASAIARGVRLARSTQARLERVDRGLVALHAWEREHRPALAALPVRSPLPGGISVPTSGFGTRRVPGGGEREFHSGLDFAAPAGTEVTAPADGVVIWTGEAPGDAGPAWWRLGRTLVLAHGDNFVTLYGHCERVEVPRGRRVRAGERIAVVGATGWTGTPQLHYEIRRRTSGGDWGAVDPRLFLLDFEAPAEAPVEPSPGGPAPAPLPRAFRP